MGLLSRFGFGHRLVDFSLGFVDMDNGFANRWCGKVGINEVVWLLARSAWWVS